MAVVDFESVDCTDAVGTRVEKPVEVVGVNGLPIVGEVGSLGPDESFVFFFFRNPSEGIEVVALCRVSSRYQGLHRRDDRRITAF